MAKFNCLCGSGGRKKKNGKGGKGSKKAADFQHEPKTLPGGLQHPVKPFETDDFKPISLGVSAPFDNPNPGNSRCNKVMNLESPVKCNVTETTNLNLAYEGEDEHDESLSMKRDYSDLDLQAHVADPSEGNDQSMNKKMNVFDSFNSKTDDAERSTEEGVDLIQSGHVSDPGIGKAEFWASPKLVRSCSDLEARDVFKKIGEKLPSSKSQSFEEMERLLAERLREGVSLENPGSPKSVMTHRSADRVMLKKHSSSQVLPSRSRRLWWKLLLWSHRNLQAPRTAKPPTLPVKPAFNQQGGYCSDTLEPNRGLELGKLESPMSIDKELSKRGSDNNGYQSWDDFHGGGSGLWTHSQWIAFPIESPVARVDEWVKELANQPPFPVNDDDHCDGGTVFPPSPDAGRSIARSTTHFNRRPDINLPEEVVHANNAIQSLNSSSKVAHISGIGLKVIPTISCFSSLRCVNLSGNLIVHVTPGSLPKGLHTLNLSRNKIGSIEGFRDLTRLRVLDLSYNRVARIGQGLSNCTLIKELYLAGNKISDVEGLHRLLKLTVLDLSFNKITTAKALGQLVANYNSLLALNLLGNPIQSNISDDQLRKAVCSLLPKLAYLNKQPINSQKAREVTTESIARAALGSSGPTPHRKPVRRVIQGGSSSSSVHRSSASISQKSRHRSKSRTHNHSSSQKTKLSALVSSH